MPKYKHINQAIANNERKQCSARGCTKTRHRISAYCKQCCRRRWYWGHPLASRITRRSDYHVEYELVRKVIYKNLLHAGIEDGIKFIESYIDAAGKGSSYVPCSHLVDHLADYRVSGLEILIEMAAVFLYGFRFHTKVRDNNHLTYLLGSKFIRFKPCRCKVKGPDHKKVGQYIRDKIGILLMNIVRTAEKLEQQQDQARYNMHQELTT